MEEFKLIKNENNILEMLDHWTICPGDIFWKKSSGKEVKVFNAGSFPSREKLEKFLNGKMQLRIELAIDEQWCEEGLALFHQLQEAESAPGKKEKMKSEARDAIMKWAYPIMWKGESEKHFLSLAAVMIKAFDIFNAETLELLEKINWEKGQRSMAASCVGSLMALGTGYTTFSFLKELFLAQVLFDISLEVGRLGEVGEKYFEEETHSPGRGEKLLKGVSESDFELIKKHMNLSYEKAWEKYHEDMNYPYLLKQIRVHHERLNGMGYPLGLNQNELSDLEVISVLSGFISDSTEFSMLGSLNKGTLRNIIEGNGETKATVLSFRLEKMIRNVFEKMDVEEDKYLEIAGL